ncbi:hypothetical protein [Demequina mangrovi]|uniref:Uncharacterized protein n=1 Tax=Demequina mangrovi TaxID=1043493 RepID=A0A1H6ZLH1_9MICO|nr:hypothetical protein [Demequina mangrovi]SEJ49665.1 hypothetical protein SAMN05421637_2017 [Demequina mangrovi]
MTVERPGSVTLVAVIAWLTALLDLAVGAWTLWLYYHPEDAGAIAEIDRLAWYGIALMVLGVLTAAVAAGLMAGSRFARAVVVGMMVLRIVGAVLVLVDVVGTAAWHAVVEMIVAVAVIGLLTTRRASAFFRAARD